MNRQLRTDHPLDDLQSWERWPLAALFMANALNIFLLYVPVGEMPAAVQTLLPWIKVLCGVAAAASLEGTLIAVTMGRRLGRNSAWSWAAMFAASAFTAAVAWYVHGELGRGAAILFMAQAVVLFIYAQHLAQPRKGLQHDASVALGLNRGDAGEVEITEIPTPALPVGDPRHLIECRYCHQQVTLAMAGQHGRYYKRHGCCVAG